MPAGARHREGSPLAAIDAGHRALWCRPERTPSWRDDAIDRMVSIFFIDVRFVGY